MGIVIVIRSLGILFAIIGVVYLLRPDFIKWLMEFFKKGSRVYFAGVLRFVLAVIFLVGAGDCRYFWIIFTFGILFLIGGLLIFTLGPEKIGRMFDWYQGQSTLVFRAIALIVLVIGAIIIYSA